MNRRIRSRTYGGVEGREPKGSPLSDRQLQSQALRPGFTYFEEIRLLGPEFKNLFINNHC